MEENVKILLKEMGVETINEGIKKLRKERFVEEEYIRFSPKNLNALDILDIVSSYGITNDSLEEESSRENSVGWIIGVRISFR